MSKYESFILAEPAISAVKSSDQDLINEIKAMVFRFSSSPGTVPERNYFANNSKQKRMSSQLRLELAKNNFPVKVSVIVKVKM